MPLRPSLAGSIGGRPNAASGPARLSRGCSRLLLACRSQTFRNRPCVIAVDRSRAERNALGVLDNVLLGSLGDKQSAADERSAPKLACDVIADLSRRVLDFAWAIEIDLEK